MHLAAARVASLVAILFAASAAGASTDMPAEPNAFATPRDRALAPVLAALQPRAGAWLARHESAFNTGDWTGVLDDYTDDAVLEAHVGGQRMEFAGVAAIHEALRLASSEGVQTRVARVAADRHTVAALITDEAGDPFMVSFWHLRDGRIERDVSIVLGDRAAARTT